MSSVQKELEISIHLPEDEQIKGNKEKEKEMSVVYGWNRIK